MAQKNFCWFILWHWHFSNFPVLRNKENFLKNFSQNSVKTALCGVVGSERNYQRVWDSSQQAKSVRQAIARTGRFTEMSTRFLWLTLIRNTKTQGFWRKHKKTDWNYHITQKAVLENGAVFCAIWPESTGGRPVLVIKAAPSGPRPFYPKSLNYRMVTLRQNVPKQSLSPRIFT